jgi:hypothetical protein
MTTLIIKSNSDAKTLLIKKLAEEMGLCVEESNFQELDVNAMAKGIGRKASDEELAHYLSKGKDAEPIDIEEAFMKYIAR